MHIAQCKKCLVTATVDADGQDVHEAVDAAGCGCCPVDHHHGQAAQDAQPCRPLIITMLPGSAPVTGA